MKEEFFYLNDLEKSELQAFLENKTLYNAVQKVLLSGVYYEGKLEAGQDADPLRNFILARFTNPSNMMPPIVATQPDAELGSKLRALIDAVSMVQTGFNQLEKLRKVEPEQKEKKNKGK